MICTEEDTYDAIFKSLVLYTMYSAGGDGDGLIIVREPKNFKNVCEKFLKFLGKNNLKPGYEPYYYSETEFHVDWLNGDQDNYVITTDLKYNMKYAADIAITI